jgi:hypothetical protein
VYKLLVEKPEGRIRHEWEDNIKIGFQEGCGLYSTGLG